MQLLVSGGALENFYFFATGHLILMNVYGGSNKKKKNATKLHYKSLYDWPSIPYIRSSGAIKAK